MNEVKKKRIILALCAVAIAVVFFFAGFGAGYGAGKGADDAPVAEAPAAETGEGMMISGDGAETGTETGNRIVLAAEQYDLTAMSPEERQDRGISPIATTAYTVTATVNGDNLTADQKKVTWSAAAFKDPSSSWASGKSVSDYVTTSPSGNKITVTCLKAFGEQIVIKCTSSFNTAVSKDLTVDYLKGISEYKMKAATSLFPENNYSSAFADVALNNGKSVPVHLPNGSTKTYTPNNSGSWTLNYFYFPMDSVTWGTGTKDNSLVNIKVELKYSSAFLATVNFPAAKTLSYNYNYGASSGYKITSFSAASSERDNPLQMYNLLYNMAGGAGQYTSPVFGTSAMQAASGLNDFLQKFDSAVNSIEVKLTLELQSGGSVEYSFYLDPQVEAMTYMVQGLELDQEDILFNS